MKIEVYCDGSSSGNATGPGGWGYIVLVDGAKLSEGSGHLSKTTNNIAELTAAIEGLQYVASNPALAGGETWLISDSQLVLRYATGEYKCRKFHLVPLYIKLRKLYGDLKAQTRWVKGHAGDTYNEACDILAKAAKDRGSQVSITQDNQDVAGHAESGKAASS